MNDPNFGKSAPLIKAVHGQGRILWLTGLSGSGKTTLAQGIKKELELLDYATYVLDGDILRKGLCVDLGFSDSDRTENIRRVGEVASLFLEAGLVAIVACISPIKNDRDRARGLVPADRFVEIFLDCPIEICEKRDPKGLYKRARKDELSQFTGISSGYEPPLNPEVHLHTALKNEAQCVYEVMAYLARQR